MDKTYVFCRYWSFFTPQFPFDQFNDLAEDQLEAELRAVVEREGPSDEAIKEWLADSWQQTLRGSVERGTPRRSRSSAPKQELPPKLREWLERRAKQGAATHTTQGTQASQRVLVHKLRYMGWLRGPTVWNWGFLKRHILVAAPTQDMAAEVAKALAQRYQSDPDCPRFGTVAAETVPVSQQLLFDQEADQRRAAAMNPLDKTGLADVARCAIDLLNRLLSPGQARLKAASLMKHTMPQPDAHPLEGGKHQAPVAQGHSREAMPDDLGDGKPAADPQDTPGDAGSGVDDLVSLDEAAAICHRSKRTLEGYLSESKMPAPHIQGGGGKPSLWKWAELRPWLEREFVPDLPKRFPRNVR